MDSIWEVTRYLRKHHKPDEKIPDKSITRVLNSLARSIRRNPPLPKGACQLCVIESDKLVPIQLKICKPCAIRIFRKSDKIKLIKTDFIEYYCDNCLGKTFFTYLINPWVCGKCMNKISAKHKAGSKAMNKSMMRDILTRPF